MNWKLHQFLWEAHKGLKVMEESLLPGPSSQVVLTIATISIHSIHFSVHV